MTEAPVNLNRVRKERARAEKKRDADASAVRFGRSKAERLLDVAREEKARLRLDAHRFEEE
jgi:hypothetical protein